MEYEEQSPPPAVPLAMPYGSKAAGPEKRKLFLGTQILALVYALLVVAFIVLAALRSNPEGAGEGAGALVLLLLAWGAGLLAWRVSRHSNLAYNVTVIVCIAFLLLGIVGSGIANVAKRIQLHQQLAKLNSDSSRLRQKTANSILQGVQPNGDDAMKLASNMDAIAKNAVGDDAIALEARAAAVRQATGYSKTRNAAYELFRKAGGIKASTLGSAEAIDERIRMIDDVLAKDDPIRKFHSEKVIAREMARRGASQAAIDRTTRSIESNPDHLTRLKQAQLDHEANLKYREVLVFLKTHRAEWHSRKKDKKVIFSKTDVLKDYNHLVHEVRALEKKRIALAKSLAHPGS